MGRCKNPYDEFRYLYHGTSRKGARSIERDGIIIARSEGGYFGWAMYVTPDRELALANYADFADEDEEPGVVLEFELLDGSRVLDLRDPDDWDAWIQSGLSRQISDPEMHKRAVKIGIAGVYDRSNDAVAVYDPSILRLNGRVPM